MLAWHYLDADGSELGVSPRFDERDDAEAWMGERWADLRDQGVEEVALFDDASGRTIYRMALSQEPA